MRYAVALLTLLIGGLVLAPWASAHVTVNPNGVAADSFSRFAVRVPNERANADTTKVVMELPEGLSFVSFQPHAGWTRTVTMEKVDPPLVVFGEKVTERVATVTWSGGAIKSGEFDEFGMSAHVPNSVGTQLVFPANQTYSNGEVVRWIGEPDADQPAPRVTLSQPVTESASATDEDHEHSSDTRANLALGFGIAALLVGVGALVLTLRRRSA